VRCSHHRPEFWKDFLRYKGWLGEHTPQNCLRSAASLKRVYVSVATRAIRPGESFRQTGDLPALAGLPDLLRKGDMIVRQLAVPGADET